MLLEVEGPKQPQSFWALLIWKTGRAQIYFYYSLSQKLGGPGPPRPIVRLRHCLMSPFKGFFDILLDNLRLRHQKLGRILQNKFVWIWTILKMILIRNVPLIQYCNTKIVFRIDFWTKRNYFENKKCQDFDKSASNCLTRYQKILWGGSLRCKKLLKFTCLTMKFHNRHHANEQSDSYFSIDVGKIRRTRVLKRRMSNSLSKWK